MIREEGMNEDIRLERRVDGQLWAIRGETEAAVRVCRCFPWSEPQRYLSLRDGEDEEVALVRRARDLDPASEKALEETLLEAGFVLQIERIVHVEEEIEIRSWNVVTRQGARSFQTPRDDWPRQLDDGGILIRDVAGDLYQVENPESLDRTSQKWLWAFVD